MWPFHSHKWQEVSCDFTPSVHYMEIKVRNSDVLERALYGFTTVVLKCSCGKIETNVSLGDRRVLTVR